MKKILSVLCAAILAAVFLLGMAGCGGKNGKESILIYTSAEDYRREYMQKRFEEQFPNYNITVEYMSTGDHAARLKAEGKDTPCDITYDLEYGYMQQLADAGVLYDLSEICDFSLFDPEVVKSKYFVPEYRNGGAIIINPQVLAEKNLPEPTSYEDLLKPEYKKLISMPNPKSSGTGYMFLRNLVNVMGEKEAFEYFDKLSENILQFTSSGSGPVNQLLLKEVGIGLGMTGQAVTKINAENANLKIVYFKEGSPYSMYGQAIISGKETRDSVKEVFKFLYETYGYENCEKFFPEKIYSDKTFNVPNYPKDIEYGNMSNDTAAEKERLLANWTH